jgi:hypothetical protein
LTLAGGAKRVAEVYSGGGYLSQSSPTLAFGLGKSAGVEQVEIRWPDGRVSIAEPPAPTGLVWMREPE